jgi:hypothetical protein
MVFLLLQWNVNTSQCNYRLVAPMDNEYERQELEYRVSEAVRQISIPAPYRDRVNAVVYECFNDGTLVVKVRCIASGLWRDLLNGDLPNEMIAQLAALGNMLRA